jgi:lipoprotein-anchoring transpeptidase ErfK/SrfK
MSCFAVITLATVWSATALAEPLGYASVSAADGAFEQIVRSTERTGDTDSSVDSSARLERHVVAYSTREQPDTIVIDTPNTYLYPVFGGGQALRYGIGVGREGFTWSGVKTIERKAEWPDWVPPDEMLRRQPYLPCFMAGGPGNPLGARALYLAGTVYRVHGTNDPPTIGKRLSSGCIRLRNDDIIDLYARVNTGSKVIVMPMLPARAPTVASQVRSGPHTTRRMIVNVARQ